MREAGSLTLIILVGFVFFAASLQKTQTPRSYAPTLLRSYAPPIHTERIRHARLQTPTRNNTTQINPQTHKRLRHGWKDQYPQCVSPVGA